MLNSRRIKAPMAVAENDAAVAEGGGGRPAAGGGGGGGEVSSMVNEEEDDEEGDLGVQTEAPPELIKPSRETPREVLYLSNLDDQLFLRFTIKYVFVFQGGTGTSNSESDSNGNGDCSGNSRVRILKQSLGDVLVHYYPMAGRLQQVDAGNRNNNNHNKLQLVCNGEGAVFVQASSAQATVRQLLSRKRPAKSWKSLLFRYDAHNFIDIPPLLVQVTRMKCGGIVVCTGLSHCVCDGIGSSQFLHAWAQLARGEHRLRINPCWDRHLLMPRTPPCVEYCHKEFSPQRILLPQCLSSSSSRNSLATSSVCFSRQRLLELKAKAEPVTPCTSFEVLAAHVWRSWVAAMEIPPAQTVRLMFSVNIRQRMQPKLEEGFYGNGFALACAETKADKVTTRLAHGVQLVQRAKAGLSDAYIRSLIDSLQLDPTQRPDMAATLVVSQWSRLGLPLVDFGWGLPVHVGPVSSHIHCLFLPSSDYAADADADADAVTVLVSVPANVRRRYESLLLLLNSDYDHRNHNHNHNRNHHPEVDVDVDDNAVHVKCDSDGGDRAGMTSVTGISAPTPPH